MPDRVKELIQILQAEEQSYEDLLRISKKKQQALIKGCLKEVEQILVEEEAAVTRLENFEEKRETVHKQLAAQLNLPIQELRLTEIAALAGEPQASELSLIQQNLARSIKLMSRINQQNDQLIRQALKYTAFSLKLIIEASNSPVYENKKKNRGKNASGKLLDKQG